MAHYRHPLTQKELADIDAMADRMIAAAHGESMYQVLRFLVPCSVILALVLIGVWLA